MLLQIELVAPLSKYENELSFRHLKSNFNESAGIAGFSTGQTGVVSGRVKSRFLAHFRDEVSERNVEYAEVPLA